MQIVTLQSTEHLLKVRREVERMSEAKKSTTPAATEVDKKVRVIKEFEKVISENQLNFRESTSLFRLARGSVFADGLSVNHSEAIQLDLSVHQKFYHQEDPTDRNQ